jgi:hypothetical protein
LTSSFEPSFLRILSRVSMLGLAIDIKSVKLKFNSLLQLPSLGKPLVSGLELARQCNVSS